MTNLTRQQTISLPVKGMACSNCVSHVEKALNALSGVSNVVVHLDTNQASVSYDPTVIDIIDLQNAITVAGYSVPTQEIILKVSGMSCVSCLAHVEGTLQDLPGVINAAVSLSQGTALVQHIAEVVTIIQMEHAIRDAGYEAHAQDTDGDAYQREQNAREGENSHPNGKQKTADGVGPFSWIRKAIKKPSSYKG
jgi:Cu+-exporting ATPase